MRTTYAVALRTHHGARRYLGAPPLRRNSAVTDRRHRGAAWQYDTLAAADRAARAYALAHALIAEVTVFRVDHIRGRNRWHAESTFTARAAGGAIDYGPATAMQARIRPRGAQ